MTEISWASLTDEFTARACAVTIGVFDGVHLGHRALIERIVVPNVVPVVVTFEQHPSEVLSHDSIPGFLTSIRQKRAELRTLGVQLGVFVDFNDAFRSLPGREFLDGLVAHFGMRRLVVGHDFRCGYRLDTNVESIRAYFAGSEVDVIEVGPVTIDGSTISSTRIRRMVGEGRMDATARMLGRPYALDLRDEEVERDGDVAYVIRDERGTLPESRQLVPAAGRYDVDLHLETVSGEHKMRSARLEIGENSLRWPLAAGESIRYIVMNTAGIDSKE